MTKKEGDGPSVAMLVSPSPGPTLFDEAVSPGLIEGSARPALFVEVCSVLYYKLLTTRSTADGPLPWLALVTAGAQVPLILGVHDMFLERLTGAGLTEDGRVHESSRAEAPYAAQKFLAGEVAVVRHRSVL